MKTRITFALLLCSLNALAADKLDLATEPLGKEGAAPVPPNMVIILDDSGSMDQNYTPDWVKDSGLCRSRWESFMKTRTALAPTATRGKFLITAGISTSSSTTQGFVTVHP